jgi:hypothetical protein
VLHMQLHIPDLCHERHPIYQSMTFSARKGRDMHDCPFHGRIDVAWCYLCHLDDLLLMMEDEDGNTDCKRSSELRRSLANCRRYSGEVKLKEFVVVYAVILQRIQNWLHFHQWTRKIRAQGLSQMSQGWY